MTRVAATLHVELLGGFRVAVGKHAVPDDAWRRRKAAGLVKLLALSRAGPVTFLQDMSQGDGAFNVATSGTSGFRETAIVFSSDVKFNTNPVHLDTPGHFTCGTP
jgi:hypothetical protein